MSDRKTVNVNQACEIAGVSRRTIYNWMWAKKLDVLRTPGGSPRLYVDQLLVPEQKEALA
jgi:excisionase family DNA binding protein